VSMVGPEVLAALTELDGPDAEEARAQ
jgi:hypothetical protein